MLLLSLINIIYLQWSTLARGPALLVDLCQVPFPVWTTRVGLDVLPVLRTWDFQGQGMMEVQCQRATWCAYVHLFVCVCVCVFGEHKYMCVPLHWVEVLPPETPKSMQRAVAITSVSGKTWEAGKETSLQETKVGLPASAGSSRSFPGLLGRHKGAGWARESPQQLYLRGKGNGRLRSPVGCWLAARPSLSMFRS